MEKAMGVGNTKPKEKEVEKPQVFEDPTTN